MKVDRIECQIPRKNTFLKEKLSSMFQWIVRNKLHGSQNKQISSALKVINHPKDGFYYAYGYIL